MYASGPLLTVDPSPSLALGIIASILFIFLPSVLILLLTRVRRSYVFLLAPAVTLTLVALSSGVSILSKTWGLGTYFSVWTACFAIVCLIRVLTYIVKRDSFSPRGYLPRHLSASEFTLISNPPLADLQVRKLFRGPSLWLIIGLICAATVTFSSFNSGFAGNWGMPSQSIDASIHYANTKGMVVIGSGSPIDTANRLSLGASTAMEFYPSMASNLGSLLAPFFGNNVVYSLNVMAWLITGVLIPCAATFLTVHYLGRNHIVWLATPLLATAFWGASWMPATAGVLWPTLIGSVSIPYVGAIAIRLGRSVKGRPKSHVLGLVLLLLVSVAVSTLSHPRAAVLAVLFATVVLWTRLVHNAVKRSRYLISRIQLIVIGVVAYLVVVYFVGTFLSDLLKDRSAYVRPPYLDTTQSIINQFSGNVITSTSVPYLVVGLVWIGILRAIVVARLRIWLVAFVFFAGLQVLVESVRSSFTNGIVMLWYGDAFRSIFAVTLCSVVLASIGLVTVGGVLAKLMRALPSTMKHGPPRSITGSICALVVLVIALVASGGFYASAHGRYVATGYRQALTPGLFELTSPSEIAFYAQIKKYVPEGNVLINDPGDGTSFAYISGGVPVMAPSLVRYAVKDPRKVYRAAIFAESNLSANCAYLAQQKMHYVIVNDRKIFNRLTTGMGLGFYFNTTGEIPKTWSLVTQSGSIKLFRISGCDQVNQPAPAAG